MITHYHVFSEHLPLQPYGLEFNVAEACVFLCDNASLMVASWSREDDDGDAKNSHHFFMACHSHTLLKCISFFNPHNTL